MKVILISGRAQNGKDTVATMMYDELTNSNKRVLITHYADLLKYICKNYLGWNGIKDDEGRRILQYVGTDVVRKQKPNLWVDFIITILNLFKDKWDYVIIPDCRFPNEVSRVKDNGFDTTLVRVVRSDFNSPLSEEQKKHQSETALDDIEADYTMHNDGTISELRELVNQFCCEV